MSDCAVSFGDLSDDAEPIEMFERRDGVRARKVHHCSECGDEIQRGESHTVFSYRFEKRFYREHRCAACQEAAAEFEFHIVGGLLWESFRDEWDQGAHITACLDRLTTAAAKRRMHAEWTKWHARELDRARRLRELKTTTGLTDGR